MRRLLPLLLALTMTATGCDLVAPCDLTASDNTENRLDRRWDLVTVNGAAIPAGGVPVPGSSDRLLGGSLQFQTTKYEGACDLDFTDAAIIDRGRVIVIYRLRNAQGQAKTSVYAGSFVYRHQAGTVTLSSKDGELTGRRVVNDVSFSETVPIFGSYTLVFRKVS